MKVFPVKICLIVAILVCSVACTMDQAEKFAFKKLVEGDLKEECGDNIECKKVVSEQIDKCLDDANWRILLDAKEGDPEVMEFYKKFRGCFKYEGGFPVF